MFSYRESLQGYYGDFNTQNTVWGHIHIKLCRDCEVRGAGGGGGGLSLMQTFPTSAPL